MSARSAVAPVFDRLANAGSTEDARAELEQASAAAWEAARLLDVDPPAEVLAVHRVVGVRKIAGKRIGQSVSGMPEVLRSQPGGEAG